MTENYKATGPTNPAANYTEEVILEKNDAGEVTKSVKVGGEPVSLSEEEYGKVSRYLVLDKDSGNGDVVEEHSPSGLAYEGGE